MENEDQEKCLRLAKLKREKKSIEEEIAKLTPSVLDVMLRIDRNKIETKLGDFSTKQLKTWVFPEEIKALEAKLKGDKITAQQNGTATFTESTSLAFYIKDRED